MAWCARRGLPARLALLVGVVLLQACEQVEVTTVGATSIELDPPSATVAVDNTVRLAARVLGDGGVPLTGRNIQWTSLDPGVAVVGSDGTVTGVAPGTASIQASAEGVSGTASVTVTSGPVIRAVPGEVEFVATRNGASPGDRTVSVSNAGGGTLGSLQATVRYVTGQGGWLTASLSSPTAPAALVLSVNQGSLAAGTYSAAVDLASPDVDGAPTSVNVTLTVVGPQPAIALGVTSVSFATAAGGPNPDSQSVGITNAGGGTLSGLSAAIEYAAGQPTGWLTATLEATTAPTSLVLRATTGQLASGTYTASVRISSEAAQNSPQTLTVTFTVGDAQPIIRLDSTQVGFAGRLGGASPGSRTVQVTNSGGGSLTGLTVSVVYPGGQPSGWLTATLNGSTAPAALTLTAATGSLGVGTYNATVQVAASSAANSPQLVQVTFTVTPPAPSIAVSSSSAQFDATLSGTAPSPVQISITNAGGGSLEGLSATVSYPTGQPTDWLTAGLNGTTAPATLTLTATSGSLGVGTYTATVSVAAEGADNSPLSISVSFTITQGTPAAPAAPGSLTATPVSDRRINLSWSDNSTDETRFDIERSSNAGSTWSAAGTVGANVTTFADESGLGGSTAYSYRVTACNAGGCSAASPTATATTAPEMPTSVTATPSSPTQISVSWSDNSPDETGFIVERATGDSQTWAAVHTAAANATSFNDTGLTAATGYRYRVQACRGAVCSRHSGEATATTPIPVPSTPGNLSATSASTTGINLSWSASTGTVAEYRIERRTGAGSYAVIASPTGSTTTYQDTGLTPATEYTYRVRACNTGGCSAYSGEATAKTATPPPTAPTGLSATAVSTSRINLAWSAATGVIDEYRIERRSGGDAFGVIATVNGTTTSYGNTGLNTATEYTYRVQACNASGCSGYSNEAAATTHSVLLPTAPTGFSASGTSSSRISLSWNHDGQLLVSGFEIQRAPNSDPTSFAPLASVGASARSYADDGLPASTTFHYRIRACSILGCSGWATATGSTQAPASTPGVPANVSASAISPTEVELGWAPPGGQTHYEVRRRTGTGGPWTFSTNVNGAATGFVNGGLTPSTTYQYQVRACASSCSEYSSQAQVTTLPDGSIGSVLRLPDARQTP